MLSKKDFRSMHLERSLYSHNPALGLTISGEVIYVVYNACAADWFVFILSLLFSFCLYFLDAGEFKLFQSPLVLLSIENHFLSHGEVKETKNYLSSLELKTVYLFVSDSFFSLPCVLSNSFLDANGFIGGNKTKEGALLLAKKALF